MNFFVFHSKNCNYSIKLLELLNQEKLLDQCQLICLEDNPDKIPKLVTHVPTIIAKNLLKPLIGKDALIWIQNKKYFNQTSNNINNSCPNPNIKSEVDDLAYNKDEVKKISDHYTNIEDKVIDKSMMAYDKIESNIIINNVSEIKESNESKESKLKKLINLRKEQLINKFQDSTILK